MENGKKDDDKVESVLIFVWVLLIVEVFVNIMV